MTSNSSACAALAENLTMKIGIQIERFDPMAGGAEGYADQLVKGLLARGHEVHLFARAATSFPAGAEFHAVPVHGLLSWQRDRCYVRNADMLAASAGLDVLLSMGRTLAMDVLQPHGGTIRRSQRQNTARLRSAVFRELKTLFNQVNPKQVLARHQELRQYSRRPLPHLVAVSHLVAADMQGYYAVPDDRLHVVYNGVDLERFCPNRLAERRSAARQHFNLADDALVFALVAHNFKLKGVAELIEAAALLNHTGYSFYVAIAGKASPRSYLETARRLGCTDRVRFTGPLTTVEDLYAAADVYVHPTWYDPCSLVVLEALASGLPVVTTRFNGAAELITEGREGFLLDSPADVRSLADRMGFFFEASRIRPMGIQARSLAENFSWDRNIEEMLRVLELAAQERQTRLQTTPAGHGTP
jgi:UDP-glucose:(heptosyl)LPS alpha-1,3-glucosyltransferase